MEILWQFQRDFWKWINKKKKINCHTGASDLVRFLNQSPRQVGYLLINVLLFIWFCAKQPIRNALFIQSTKYTDIFRRITITIRSCCSHSNSGILSGWLCVASPETAEILEKSTNAWRMWIQFFLFVLPSVIGNCYDSFIFILLLFFFVCAPLDLTGKCCVRVLVLVYVAVSWPCTRSQIPILSIWWFVVKSGSFWWLMMNSHEKLWGKSWNRSIHSYTEMIFA